MSIIFVHGTGVRLRSFMKSFETAKSVAATAGITDDFVECPWGDPLGSKFSGLSLPGSQTEEQLRREEEDFAFWSWLFEDPLFELSQLTIRDDSKDVPPSRPDLQPEWLQQWERVFQYRRSDELTLLLDSGGLGEFWEEAWRQVVRSTIPRRAFEASKTELPEVHHALARALIAQVYVVAIAADAVGPSRQLREKLVDRLIVDWGQEVYGLVTFLSKWVRRKTTTALARHRNSFTEHSSSAVGDILLYQSNGEVIREFIRTKVEAAQPPVTIVAHSLGGIACVDLLALPDPPVVARLVTLGSQAPLLYELGALYSLKPPTPLPDTFPAWLNIYDRNDFLSYVASRLWPGVQDLEVESGQPFPEAHSAYLGNEESWAAIREFIADDGQTES